MTNKYNTIRKAIISFNKSKGWKIDRSFFKKDGEVAICFTEDEKYFIITNRGCVNYRKDIGQVVYILSYNRKTDIFS